AGGRPPAAGRGRRRGRGRLGERPAARAPRRPGPPAESGRREGGPGGGRGGRVAGGYPSGPMYAIVKVGGKQYRVEKGDSLVVDRLHEDQGAKVALEPL